MLYDMFQTDEELQPTIYLTYISGFSDTPEVEHFIISMIIFHINCKDNGYFLVV